MHELSGGGRWCKHKLFPGFLAIVICFCTNVPLHVPVLLASLSSTYLHQKFAIAVDDDVDIYDPADVAWAITTRVDPIRDMTIIPGMRGHALDESVTEKLREPQVKIRQELVSKVLIDATKPPTSDPEHRAVYERLKPLGLETIHHNFSDLIGKKNVIQ